MSSERRKYWIGVASKDHVASGIKLGICQFCHGQERPAKILKKGDVVIYYSPKYTMSGSEPYQKFTAMGVVKDDAPYQIEMDNGFKPFRRNIDYLDAKHVEIRPLISHLPFIKNKRSWGSVFRYGFIQIGLESFECIAAHMLEPIDFTTLLQEKT